MTDQDQDNTDPSSPEDPLDLSQLMTTIATKAQVDMIQRILHAALSQSGYVLLLFPPDEPHNCGTYLANTGNEEAMMIAVECFMLRMKEAQGNG